VSFTGQGKTVVQLSAASCAKVVTVLFYERIVIRVGQWASEGQIVGPLSFKTKMG
jgi:hypothetical protein